MKPHQLLIATTATIALASCQLPSSNQYDTDPYGLPDASYDDPAFGDAVYDTPPVYEDGDAPDLEPAESAGPSYRYHKVVRGDTLSGISAKYNVSMNAIKRANNMSSTIVVLGDTLKVPVR